MTATAPAARLMSGADYRESLRRYSPTVFVNGRRVASVADERAFQPGLNAIALTYDYALKPEYARLMTAAAAQQRQGGEPAEPHRHEQRRPAQQARSRAPGVPGDRLRPALPDARRAQRASARSAPASTTRVAPPRTPPRFLNYLHRVQDQDLTLGVAMTDAKGDRS